MKIDVMGLPINFDSKESILNEILERTRSNKKTFIVTPYSEFYYYAAKDNGFKRILKQADFSLPDGTAIFWATYFQSIPFTVKNYYLKILQGFWQGIYSGFSILIKNSKLNLLIAKRIPGSLFFWDLVELAEKDNLKIYLLGGYGETPKIVAAKIKEKNKNIIIAGYSNASANNVNIEEINASDADIIFVAFGPVKQEKWIAQNIQALNAKIFIGIGGTFDYIAGATSQPPSFFRQRGLEWFYRLITQPRRFKRIWHATVSFTLGALRYKVFSNMPFRENAAGVIINEQNKIFVARRAKRGGSDTDPGDWQFPQGGIDKNEPAETAVKREMKEELGISNLEILGKAQKTFSYTWPHFFRKFFFNKYRYNGQSQQIFFLKLDSTKPENKIVLDKTELSEYCWVNAAELISIISPVRQEMLRVVLEDIYKYL